MSQILWNIPKWPKLISLMLADHNEKTFNRWFYDWRPKWNLHKITICSLQIPFQFLFIARNFTRYFTWQSGGTKEDKINQKMSHFLFKLKSVSRPLETIWGYLRPLRLFETMWGYLRPCEAIEVIWDHVRLFEAMCGHLRPLRSYGYQRGQN